MLPLLAAAAVAACGPRSAPASSASGGGGDVPADLPPACEEPFIECDGRCIDPRTDPDHCGGCNRPCRVITPGRDVPNEQGACVDGWCEPSFNSGCIDPQSTRTCTEICDSEKRRCIERGCSGQTVYWTANYSECIMDFDTCLEPDATACSGDPLDLLTYQDVSCDTPLDEAFAQTGLPPKPPEQTDGPYAGWIPFGWLARCCCEPYHFE